MVGDEKFIASWYGDRVGKMDEMPFKNSLRTVIAEICLLTGLETYSEEKQKEMYQLQMRVISKFILNGFSFLTPKELINAFYLNLQGKYGDVLKQYGVDKKLNCEFIGQVLTGYTNYKSEYINTNPDLLKIIQPQSKLILPAPPVDIANEERVMIEGEFQKFLRDHRWNYRLLFECCYERLVADDQMAPDFYKRYVRKAKILMCREKQKEKLIPTSVDKKEQFFNDGSIGVVLQRNFDNHIHINNELHQIRNESDKAVVRLAKQFAVCGYFKYRLRLGFNNIYVRENSMRK